MPYSSSPTNTHRKTIDAARSTSYRDHAAGRLLSEDGPWANNTVTYGCTAPMRTTLSLQSPNADPWNQSYGYDAAYRLTATASPARSFACEYDYPRKLNAGNSDLPDTSDITRFYGTATGPLSTQLETSGGSTLDPYWYDFDVSNQETRITHAAGNLIAYDYDAKGRLTSMRVFNNCFAGTFTFVHDGWNPLAGITYAYGPFGELIRATGPMAKANPFRFSTKYQDDESDLLYYGYRYYSPQNGRFLGRDPLEEKGGLNLYANVGNNELNFIDPDGRGFFDCVKALAKLAKAEARLATRVAEVEADYLGTGLDANHLKSLNQAIQQVNDAYRAVVQNCPCDKAAAAALLASAAATLQAALNYFEQVATDPQTIEDIEGALQAL